METLFVLIAISIVIWLWSRSSNSEPAASIYDDLPPMVEDFQSRLSKNSASPGVFRMDPNPIQDRGTVLQNKEEVVLDAPVVIARSIKTGAKWKSGSKGIRVTPIKGLSFNVGGTKGRMTQSTEFQQDVGWLTLTTKRICFTGKSITFAVPLSKIQNISREESICFIDLSSRDIPDFHAEFTHETVALLFTKLYTDPNKEISINITNV